MFKKHFFIIALLTLTAGSVFSQDIHFTQFYASPLTLNPANTGRYKGDWRAMYNFRRQWKSITTPFFTTSLGYDQQFYLGTHNLSGGGIFVYDRSGDGRLSSTKLLLSGAYHKTISENRFSGGLQLGYVRRSFTISDLTFPDQFDNDIGGFNPAASHPDAGLNQSYSYIDASAGVAWSRTFGKIEPFAGLALFHVNRPKDNFTDTKAKLPMRKVFHGGANIDVTPKIFVTPNILYMAQRDANDLLIGSNVGYRLPQNPASIDAVYTGFLFRDGFGRNADALAAIIGARFRNFDLGISYDYNVSDLKVATNHKGAIEFSLIYTTLSTVPEKITIPCDRY